MGYKINNQLAADRLNLGNALRNNQLGVIVKFYCNLGHVVGMCPFRLSKDKKLDKYIIKTSCQQKVFCIIATLILLLYTIGNIRNDLGLVSEKKKHPYLCFLGGFGFCRFVLNILNLKFMWLENQSFVNLINFLATKNNLPPIPTRNVFKIKAVLLSVAAGMVGGIVSNEIITIHQSSAEAYLLQYYYTGRHHFYFEKYPHEEDSNATDFVSTNPTLSADYIFLAWFTLITNMYWYGNGNIKISGLYYSIVLKYFYNDFSVGSTLHISIFC